MRSPWLYNNIHMDGVEREVNARVLKRSLDIRFANNNRFEINQLLFADDTPLVPDSVEKL